MRYLLFIMAILALPAKAETVKQSMQCLYIATYKEARGEGIVGKLLVAKTLINRAKVNRSSICTELRAKGQFPWFSKKSKYKYKHDDLTVRSLKMLFEGRLETDPKFKDVFYFHNINEKPQWRKRKQFLGRHGGHLFYKES